jgi:hypothetical protein
LRGSLGEGCEFLADTRDPTIWEKVQEHAKAVGGAGMAVMWELAKAELKKKLGLGSD